MADIEIDIKPGKEYDKKFVPALLLTSPDAYELTANRKNSADPADPKIVKIYPIGSSTLAGTIDTKSSPYKLKYSSDQDGIGSAVLTAYGVSHEKFPEDATHLYYALRHQDLNDRIVNNGIKGQRPDAPLRAVYNNGVLYTEEQDKDRVETAKELAKRDSDLTKRDVSTQNITALDSLIAAGRPLKRLPYTKNGENFVLIYDEARRNPRVLAIFPVGGGKGQINQKALQNDYNLTLLTQPFIGSGGTGSGPSSNSSTPMTDNEKHGWLGAAVVVGTAAAGTWAARTQRNERNNAAQQARPERKSGLLQFVKGASVALGSIALAVTLDAALNKSRVFNATKNTFNR